MKALRYLLIASELYKGMCMSIIRIMRACLLFICTAGIAYQVVAADKNATLDAEVEALDVKAVELEKDINALEKELLFPPLTRVEVYLSIDPELRFDLRTLALNIDNDEKTFHVYNNDDLSALRLGGLQPVWEGNVALGEHQVEVFFEGLDHAGKKLKGTATASFKKTRIGHSLEIQVLQGKSNKTPTFTVKNLGGK